MLGQRQQAIIGLALTVLLAVFFTAFQGYEYYEAPFTISDTFLLQILHCFFY